MFSFPEYKRLFIEPPPHKPASFPFALCIDELSHPRDPVKAEKRAKVHAGQRSDADVALLPSNSKEKIRVGYTKHGADEDVVQLGGGGWSPRPDLLSAARRTSRWRAANAGDGDHSHGVGSAPKARSLGIKSRPEIPLLPSQTTVYS